MCRWCRYSHINGTSTQLAGEEWAVRLGDKSGLSGLATWAGG